MNEINLDWSQFHAESKCLKLFKGLDQTNTFENDLYYIVKEISKENAIEFLRVLLEYKRIERSMLEGLKIVSTR